MTLVPCPECGRAIDDASAVCPHCRAAVQPIQRLLADAWTRGLSNAWKAALAFPLLFVLVAFLRAGGRDLAAALPPALLPYIALIALWGFVAGMTAIGIAAMLRRIVKGRDEHPWAWSDHAVAAVILAFGIWLSRALMTGLQ